MFRLRKGEWGYFRRKKTYLLLMCFVCVMMIFGLCITGYLTTGNTANLLTVIAVLSALPLGNFAVLYIAIFPYASVNRAQYDALKKEVKYGIFLAELAITSGTEPTLPVEYALVHAREVILFSGSKFKGDIKKEQTYIEGILAANGYQISVAVFTELRLFQKRALQLQNYKMEEAEEDCLEPIAAILKNISI